MKTLQDQFILIKEGKGSKQHFLFQARKLFPDLVNQYTSYDHAVGILKGRRIINEILKEEKKTDVLKDFKLFAYQPEDTIDINQVLKGFYVEMHKKANKNKTRDEIKDIVYKNLESNINYYTNKTWAGLEDSRIKELPKPKEIKGKYAGWEILKESKKEINEQDEFFDPYEREKEYKESKYHLYYYRDSGGPENGPKLEIDFVAGSNNIEELKKRAFQEEEYFPGDWDSMESPNYDKKPRKLNKQGLPMGYSIELNKK